MRKSYNRLRNIGLLMLALSVALVRRRAERVRRILVVQGGKLGDMVCTTPMFEALRQQLPGAELYVAGSATNKDLLAGDPRIKEFVVLPDEPLRAARVLRMLRPEAVCLTAPNFEMLVAATLARAPQIITPTVVGGWCPFETRAYRILALFVTTVPHRMGSYAPREYLRLLEPLRIHATDTTKKLFVSEAAIASVGNKLRAVTQEGTRLMGMSGSAGNALKPWPPERFGAVAAHIVARGAKVVLTGVLKERAAAEEVAKDLPQGSVLNLCGELSVEELKALMGYLAAYVAVDTGPIYVAEAFGVPTVDIVGPMDEREQPPNGPLHKVVVPPGRTAPVLHIMNASVVDKAEAQKQILATEPAHVIKVIDELWPLLKK